MQSPNTNDRDVQCMLSDDEWKELIKGKASLIPLIRAMVKSRDDCAKKHEALFRNDRVVIGNVKRMYEELIERKQQLLVNLMEETCEMKRNKRTQTKQLTMEQFMRSNR